MSRCVLFLTIALAASAQQASVVPNAQPSGTVPSGAPLRVVLEHRVALTRVGQPIQARLVDPVYVFDRVVLPAGTVVEGHVAEIGGVPAIRRVNAILSGNLTPPRDVRAQFDALVLSDGSRVSLRTSLSRGTAHTVRIETRGKEQHPPALETQAAILAFTAPGRISRLKSCLTGMLPYHREAWPKGTLFTSVLEAPVTAPLPGIMKGALDSPPVPGTEGQNVHARLLAPISSATARRGAPVEAVVVQPLFSSDHELLIPEGSRLLGHVEKTQPARPFHRNGRLLFVFRQIRFPAGGVQGIQGNIEGLEASFDAHLSVDLEGAVHVSSPKTRFLFPAFAIAAAGLSLHQDYNAQGVPDQDVGGRAESGAVGLGLIGTAVAQTSRAVASSIAFAGAGFSVYSTFIARGEDVVLPVNTPVRIGLGARGGDAIARQPMKRSLQPTAVRVPVP